VPVAL